MNTPSNEPRVLWIAPGEGDTDDDDLYYGDALTAHPQQGPLQWQSMIFPVIERSAYDKVCAENTSLKAHHKDHEDDWIRIQNAERENERLRTENERLARNCGIKDKNKARLERMFDELETDCNQWRALADNLAEVLKLCLPDSNEPQATDISVKHLGDQIGYGTMMAAASRLWGASLAAKGYPVGGEQTAGPCRGTVDAVLATYEAMVREKG